MYHCIILTFVFAYVYAGSESKGDFKNQFCTDPRTFKKHPAYSEWADAYSCTRHRCQPGGRSLAIYTVGCKRVEPPEAAIECEEVVEDTNMQFPFCCTRLRCLVIVRGEVWTKVLGQPWETLPAAPWSHMYKMKRPPPNGAAFLPKEMGEGPIYELATETPKEKKLRSMPSSRSNNENIDCPECEMRASGVVSPDIVIALTTGNEDKELRRDEKKSKYSERNSKSDDDEEMELERAEAEFEDKREASSTKESKNQLPWTDIPQNQWVDTDSVKDQIESKEVEVEKPTSPFNLQALVDAISTRMRDIENVVQKMSEKVTHDGRKNDDGYIADEDDRQRAVNVINEDPTTETSLEDNVQQFYSNSKSARRKPPSEPSQFVAPIETGRKPETKRHHHKKHQRSGRVHKKTRRNKKVRKEINAISLEDSRMN